jgi:hypothetical protein
MNAAFLNDERLAELLAQEATDGLNSGERVELERLLANYPDADAQALEKTAAALLLSTNLQAEPLPAQLRNKLIASADAYTSKANAAGNVVQLSAVRPPRRAALIVPWLAAAASIALALVAWWPRFMHATDGISAQAQPDQHTLQKLRDKLVIRPNAIAREWTATKDPNAPAVSGDIVWDNKTQTGYVRFRGLPANDPHLHQYQLWIFDGARSDKYPIDGGVFDMTADNNGDIVIPIKAKLPVRDPAMFAVTLEQPGGAVVSEREHILALAKVQTG